MMPTRPDVTVIGAGLIGLATAWRARGAGLSVALFDPAPGRAASWAGAGMLAPVTEAHFGEEKLLELNLEAARNYEAFVEEVREIAGVDVGYRRCGTLNVARHGDDMAVLDELFDYQLRLGLNVQRLRASECRALEPALAPALRGGLYVAGDHQVDNRALVTALLVACERSGVELHRRRVVSVDAAPLKITDEEGDVTESGAVVLATGASPLEIDLPEGAAPRVRPVKGQLLHLRTRDGRPPLSRNVRGLDVYLVPRTDGRLVVGATVEEQGHDLSATAGGVMELLDTSYELLPGIAEMAMEEIAVGSRPGSPDNAPIIGATAVQGIHVAVGHHRNGILLADVTARMVVEGLNGKAPSGPFSPGRFGPS